MLTIRLRGLTAVFLVVCAATVVGFLASHGAADDPAKKATTDPAKPNPEAVNETELRNFMRKKLAASNEILEGLTTDDLDLVESGARKLHELSSAERWRVSNDPIYRQFSGDFREITQQLIKASEEGNADRAAMKWMDATISCLDCHRFVRGMHVAGE